MTAENIEERLSRLRTEWPADWIVDRVMSQIGKAPEPVDGRARWLLRPPRRPRFVAALAASGLIAALGLAWGLIASHPANLQAAVEQNFARDSERAATRWQRRACLSMKCLAARTDDAHFFFFSSACGP